MESVLFFQFLVTLFISGGLFFKEHSLKNKTIAIYFFLFSIEILYFLYALSGIYKIYPQFHGRFYFSLGLLYGPLLFFHFKTITNNKKQFFLKDLLHFIPLIVLNISMLDIILMSDVERLNYFDNQENFYSRIMNLNYARAIHQIFYGIIFISFFIKNKAKLDINKKFYLGGISIIYFVTTIAITLLTLFASGWKDFAWYYLLCNTFIFLIGYVLYTDPKIFKKIKKKYEHSNLSTSEMMRLKLDIEKLFLDKKPYLNNSFNVDVLANELNTKPNYISQTFTETFKENFNDFVNRNRIKYAKTLLKDENYKHLKIEAIAQESGFNNKVTFYKAFSKFENTTPSVYRKNKL